ncbi:MAG TPA: hypothetical protein VFQ45_22715 [Longimicrobium sp.]|nr:hypothetical protein [Longimicrobium sp.]
MLETIFQNGPDTRPVPDSRDLRLAADWASAVRGAPLRFSFAGGQLSAGAEEASSFFACETKPYARRPRVVHVDIEAGGTSMSIGAGDCSALVWGESAVEKFLFPYYASAAGRDAAALLRDLSAVWYDYPPTVEVCALAYGFGCTRPEGLLSLRDTVGVVFLDRRSGALRRLTLDRFLEEVGVSRRRDPRDHAAAPPGHAFHSPLRAPIASVVLRDAAEYVSGTRPRLVRFTQHGWLLAPSMEGAQPEPSDGPPWFSAAGTVHRPDRLPISLVRLVVEPRSTAGTDTIVSPLLGTDAPGNVQPDAAFWSDGAVEKLMLPYYASVKGWAAPVLNSVMMAKWSGRVGADEQEPVKLVDAMVKALDEPAKRILEELGNEGDADVGAGWVPQTCREDMPESQVYAATHLPHSEYIYLDREAPAPSAVEHRIILHALSGGAPTAVPLVRPRRRSAAHSAGGR